MKKYIRKENTAFKEVICPKDTMMVEETMKQWAKSDPKFVKFANYPQLLKQMYLKHYVAKNISECLEDMNAELELAIVDEKKRNPIKLCKECRCKECKCGEQDYTEYYPKAYSALDTDGKGITVNLPPWYKGEVNLLETDELYRIKGKITEFKGKLSLDAIEIQRIGDFSESEKDSAIAN